MATETAQKSVRVVLGITGGVAAYKSAELTRLLKKAGIDVQVVMTEAGTKFITPVTMQALSGNPVFIDAWDDRIDNNMAHIELSRSADAILVAPASADFLAKLANGIANDLLSTLVLARQPTCALLVAPAMNREMWENPATRRNIARLIADGVIVLGPDRGDQACGETGMGRMLEPAALLAAVQNLSVPKTLAGKHALVTAGPTFEPIDPVRGITNSSSGKMGYAIAQALIDAGASVTLVSGPTTISEPFCEKIVRVTTASQMFDAVKAYLDDVDVFFSVAAVAVEIHCSEGLDCGDANLDAGILTRSKDRLDPFFAVLLYQLRHGVRRRPWPPLQCATQRARQRHQPAGRHDAVMADPSASRCRRIEEGR